MTMFNVRYISFLAIIICLVSCNSDDPLAEGTFVRESIEKGNSTFFVLSGNNNAESISAEGTFADFDEILFQDFDFNALNFFLEEITLISENEVQVKMRFPSQELLDTTLFYIDVEEPKALSIVLDEDQSITLEGTFSSDESSVSFAYKSYACSFQNGLNVEYSPLIIEQMGIFENENDVIDEIISDFQLTSQDTIALNMSNIIMRRE